MRLPIALALCAPTLLACTTRDDDYLLLRRVETKDRGAPTRFVPAARNDSEAYYVRHLLANGFGAELLRTYAMAKRFAARTQDHRETRTTIALGAPEPPAAGQPARVNLGFWVTRLSEGTPVIWIDDSPERRQRSTMADLVSGFGNAITDVVAPETGNSYARSRPLRDGYVAFLEVVAAEWRTPFGTDDRDELRRLPVFTAVRSNLGALPGHDDAQTLAENPTVVATVLYRLASSSLRQRMADPAVYQPFLEAQPPRDVHPALLLGAFRNFQAKLLSAWSRASIANRPPHNLVDLVEAYADAYPAERAEVMRIFLVTTYAATALRGGVPPGQPPDVIESQLATLTADVLFGRRGLRDGFPGR